MKCSGSPKPSPALPPPPSGFGLRVPGVGVRVSGNPSGFGDEDFAPRASPRNPTHTVDYSGFVLRIFFHITPWNLEGTKAPKSSVWVGFRVSRRNLGLHGAPRSEGVQGLGFRVQGSGFRVQGSGFRVQGSGFKERLDLCDAAVLKGNNLKGSKDLYLNVKALTVLYVPHLLDDGGLDFIGKAN